MLIVAAPGQRIAEKKKKKKWTGSHSVFKPEKITFHGMKNCIGSHSYTMHTHTLSLFEPHTHSHSCTSTHTHASQHESQKQIRGK